VQLATQYFLGRGAPKDWALAAKWYEAAAEQGDVGAQYIIASFYEHGDGVPKNLRRALHWYVQAAQQGDIGAAVQAKDVARRLADPANPPR
jgi:TPR repeat protein